MKLNCRPAYIYMSDKANLLDLEGGGKVGRFAHYIVAESAVIA